MIDPHKKVREAFYTVLNGNLSYDGENVPVVDDAVTLEDNVDMYVLLSSQTAVEVSNFTKYQHDCTITIDITHKTTYSVTKNGVDEVAQQIFDRISTGVTTNGLPISDVIQYVNLQKETDNYLEMELSSGAIIRRIVVFNLLVHEK